MLIFIIKLKIINFNKYLTNVFFFSLHRRWCAVVLWCAVSCLLLIVTLGFEFDSGSLEVSLSQKDVLVAISEAVDEVKYLIEQREPQIFQNGKYKLRFTIRVNVDFQAINFNLRFVNTKTIENSDTRMLITI